MLLGLSRNKKNNGIAFSGVAPDAPRFISTTKLESTPFGTRHGLDEIKQNSLMVITPGLTGANDNEMGRYLEIGQFP